MVPCFFEGQALIAQDFKALILLVSLPETTEVESTSFWSLQAA